MYLEANENITYKNFSDTLWLLRETIIAVNAFKKILNQQPNFTA